MNRKPLVLYKSSTGFTKRYAEWIAAELGCDLADFKAVTPQKLSQYDTVIFGSRAYAEHIDGLDKAKALVAKSGGKQLILFVTGATPNAAEQILQKFWAQNLTHEELQSLPHFYMQAGLNYEKMSLKDKLMMKAAAAMIKKKKDKTPEDEQFEQAIAGSYDISSPEYIAPLVSFVRGLE